MSYVKFVMCTLLPVPGRNWISMGSLSQSLLTAHNSTQYTNAQQTDYSTPSLNHITLRLTRVVSTLTPQEVKNEIVEEREECTHLDAQLFTQTPQQQLLVVEVKT